MGYKPFCDKLGCMQTLANIMHRGLIWCRREAPVNEIYPNTCTLRLAADGQTEVCSRERCPFWLPGRAVLEGGCIVERLGVDVRSPAVARYLLGGRERLERRCTT